MRLHLSRDLHTLREKPQRDSCFVWSKLMLGVIMIVTSMVLLVYPLILIFRVTTNEEWLFWEGIGYIIINSLLSILQILAFLFNLLHIHLSVISYSIVSYVSLSLCILNTIMVVGVLIFVLVIDPNQNLGIAVPDEFAYFGIAPSVGYFILFCCSTPITLLELIRVSIAGPFKGIVTDEAVAQEEAEKWNKFRVDEEEQQQVDDEEEEEEQIDEEEEEKEKNEEPTMLTPREEEEEEEEEVIKSPRKLIEETSPIKRIDSQQDASLAVTTNNDFEEEEEQEEDVEPNVVTVRPTSSVDARSPLIKSLMVDNISPITPVVDRSSQTMDEPPKFSGRSNGTDEDYELVEDDEEEDDQPVIVAIRSYSYSPPPQRSTDPISSRLDHSPRQHSNKVSPRLDQHSNKVSPLNYAVVSAPNSARSVPLSVSSQSPPEIRNSLPLMLALHPSSSLLNNSMYQEKRNEQKSVDTNSSNHALNERLMALENEFRSSKNQRKEPELISQPISEISPYQTPRDEQTPREDLVVELVDQEEDSLTINSQKNQPLATPTKDDFSIIQSTPLSPEIIQTKAEIEAARRKKEELHLRFKTFKKQTDPAANK